MIAPSVFADTFNLQTGRGAGATPAVKLPAADELSAWVDLLGNISDELIGDEAPPAPARDTTEAAVRALQVTGLRLWLTGLLSVRVHADAGLPLKTDAEGLPYIGNVSPAH